MAFNPFHSFRRYSKTVFAGLAILCMFTFVLSSGMGQGDFFSQMAEVFGGGGGNKVVTLHGTKIDAREFDSIQNQRRLAGEYMDAAIGASFGNLQRRLGEISTRLDPESRSLFQLALQNQNALQFVAQRAETDKKVELQHALAAAGTLMDLQMTMMARPAGEKFFGPIDKFEDTVNFLIWRHEADQLGIRLSNDDISHMIATETRGEFSPEAAQAVDQMFRQRLRGGYSPEALYVAVGEELRVRMAQLALTGSAVGAGRHTLSAPPNPPTPQESWQLFKDARTTVRVGLIDVPVRDFIPKVTATPTDDGLRKLFEKYKNDEPAPDRADPGFKEPRKVQVAWIAAAADLPYYKAAADRMLALAPALRLLGNTAPASALLVPVQRDAEVLAQEKAFRMQEQPWTTSFPQLHETSVQRAENVAALVGAAVQGPVGGALAMQTAALRREAQDRAKIGVSMIGLASTPDPFGVFGAPVALMPTVTLDQLRSQLREKAKDELLTGGPAGQFDRGTTPVGLIASDLYTFRGEVMKLGREKKAEVEKYVTEFVRQRGVKYGQSTEPRDQYHLGDDPGVAPLKEAYRKANGDRDLLLRQFSQEFFADHAQQSGGPDGVFIPHKYVLGRGEESHYYWWRTEDVPAKTPRFEKARDAVAEAWKLLQARELAKKEADRLEDLAKRAQGDPARLRDVAAQNGGREYFDLGPIAPYMPQINPTGSAEYVRDYAMLRPGITPEQIAKVFHVTADKVAYPGADMVQSLLSLREKEKGATAVVSDKPQQHYYAAALLDRQEPTQDEFRQVYKGSMARAGVERDPLLQHLSRGRGDEYRKAVLEQLKAEAKLVVNEPARRGGES